MQRRSNLLISLVFAVLLLLRFVASVFPNARLWGLHFFAFIPLWLALVSFLLGVLFCTPNAFSIFESFAKIIFKVKTQSGVLITSILISSFLAIIFWMLRMKTFFLGDGAVYLAELYRLANGLPISENVLYSKGSAPLTGLIHAFFVKLIANTFLQNLHFFSDTRSTFYLVGIVCGFVFALIAYQASRHFGKNDVERLGILCVFRFSAGTIFYFGYVEYYTIAFTTLALYFYLSLRALEDKRKILLSGIVLLLSSALHLLALVALPSFLFVLLSHVKSRRIQKYLLPKYIAVSLSVILFTCGAYYFATGVYAKESRVLMPLLEIHQGEIIQSYTLLSTDHSIDFLNLIVLLSSPAIIAIAFLYRRSMIADRSVQFTLINLFFFLCLAFFGYSGFGLSRDWDIHAVLRIAFLFVLIAVIRQSREGFARRYISYAVAGAAIAHTLPWLVVNINPESSVARYKSIIALDAVHLPADYVLNGYEHLRKWYFSEHDAQGEIWATQHKIEIVGYPSDFRTLQQIIATAVPPEDKLSYYSWMLEKIFSKLEIMNHTSRDSIYAGTKHKFIELSIENIFQCYFLNDKKTDSKQVAINSIAQLENLVPTDPLLELLHAQVEKD